MIVRTQTFSSSSSSTMTSLRKKSFMLVQLCFFMIILLALLVTQTGAITATEVEQQQQQQQQQNDGKINYNVRRRRNAAAAAVTATNDASDATAVHHVQMNNNNNKKQSNHNNNAKNNNNKNHVAALVDDSASNTKTTDTTTIKVEVPSSSSTTDEFQEDEITTTENIEELDAATFKRSNWVTVLSYSFLLLTIIGFVGSFVLCCIHIRRDFYLIDRDALKERIRRERIFDFATKRRADILESVFAKQCFQACSTNQNQPLHPQNQNNAQDNDDDEECGNCHHQQQQRSNNKIRNGHYSALASSSSMEDDDNDLDIKNDASFESNNSTSTPVLSSSTPPPPPPPSSSSPRRPMIPKKSQQQQQQEESYHSSPLSVYDSSAYYNSQNMDSMDECDGLRSSSRSILLRVNSQGELDSELMQQCQYHCSLPDGNSSERKFPTLSPSFSNDNDDEGDYASVLQPLPKDSNQQDSSNEDLVDECAICLCEHEIGEVLTRSKHCTHVFHKECIFQWLKSHDVCPCCRTPLITEDEVLNAASTLLKEQQKTTKTTRQ